MDVWTTIKVLYNRGVSIRQIAKQLKISRNTVRKYLNKEGPLRYKKSARYGSKSKWEGWKKEIIEMYYNKKFVGSRIFEELKKRGAEGSRTGLYTYLKRIKQEDISGRIRERYETGPGDQAQFDWSPYTVRIGSEYRKIYVFCIILSFSRFKYYVASFDKTQQSVFLAIERAFRYFGGVPRRLLMDNAKQMVEEPNPRIFRWNRKFLEFLGYYGVEPNVHGIRRPFTKGKVEEPFSYLENHFIKGGEFKDFDDLLGKLQEFTDNYNRRHNLGINTTPAARFEEEKKHLGVLPRSYFVSMKEEWRKVNYDCLLSYGGNKYSVPFGYASKHVWVRSYLGYKVQIFSQSGKIIAEHLIPRIKGQVIIKDEHYRGLRRYNPTSIPRLRSRFLELFPGYEEFLEKLAVQKKASFRHHLGRIIALTEIYKREDVARALDSALEYNVFNHDYVFAYLTSNCDIEYRPFEQGSLFKDWDEGTIKSLNKDVRRDLGVYESVGG